MNTLLRLASAALFALCITASSKATVVFNETFGTTSPGANTTGLYSAFGANRSVIMASSFRLFSGSDTPSVNGSTGIRLPSSSQRSTNAIDGVTGASGLNGLRFSPENAGSITSQWYQFNAIPLTGHIGDQLEVAFLFRPITVLTFSTPSDFFSLSVSWDGTTFNDIGLTFTNGNNTTLDSWKTVTGSALTIQSESIWIRITANPTTQGAFPEMYFDDLKLSTSATAVPEPATFAFLGGLIAIIVAGGMRRRHIH
jgi:hypothetical protein